MVDWLLGGQIDRVTGWTVERLVDGIIGCLVGLESDKLID